MHGMKLAPVLVLGAALLCPSLARAVEPAAAEPAPRGPAEPKVQQTVIDGDDVHIEELRVRGQTQSIVVTSKIGGRYEIYMGNGARDLSEGPSSRRGAVGQRVWRLLEF